MGVANAPPPNPVNCLPALPLSPRPQLTRVSSSSGRVVCLMDHAVVATARGNRPTTQWRLQVEAIRRRLD